MDRGFLQDLHHQRPWTLAALVAAIYCAVAATYIYASSLVAAQVSTDIMDLQRIEKIKGVSFIIVTTLLLFLGLRFLLARLGHRESLLERQNLALVEAEKRATAGLFASSVAHDLNNLVTISRSCIDELRALGNLDGEDRELLEELAEADQGIRDCAKRLADARAREQGGERVRIDVSRALREALDLACSHERVKQCEVRRQIPEALEGEADGPTVQRALINMVLNAADATGGQGKLLVIATPRDDGHLLLEVHDEGPGIPPGERARVAEPFYTTKANGSGLGFLSLRYCARRHDGKVEISDSEHLGGACVRLWLHTVRELGCPSAAPA